ncbi:four-carbon acid sugar kinase family protein [Shinella sp. CPCC 100929]|uniref:Four-carbon acid sugar kinase family protein n=1 Tax=Shinella lacus TaxID=2654216 RepID=A0ABT1R0J9_9HYPH|nr:four-carbon acid sugar kinase family protein [Shinella lacus]MCQ4628703.1 four-carbon acid sugar kinase family protein [Shinella lacus]
MQRALGIVADDFTGALMVAGYLEGAGIHCPVLFSPDAEIPPSAVVIAGTRARTVPVSDALGEVGRFADAFTRAGCKRLAYKACATFDSTEDGNIGPVADYLADRAGVRPVLMSAGFPRFGTTVHQGYMFYRGRLVSESIKRFDPLTPMSDPDLVRFLGRQTPHRIALLSHGVLRNGTETAVAAIEAFAADDVGHIFLDTTDDGDVEVAAEVAAAMSRVVVASDPLIIDYAIRLGRAEQLAPVPWPRHVEGPTAVLAGSVGPVMLAQLAAFSARYPVLTLDLLDPAGEDGLISKALDWASGRIGAAPLAISTSVGPDEVAAVQAAFGAVGAARRAERIFGAIARGLRDRGVRRFVVAGGETSGAVVNALDIASVRALPEGALGTGFCVSPGPVPLSLYLKPGKLGADDILLRAIEDMNR